MTSELWKSLLVGVVAMGLVACKQESTSSTPPAQPAATDNDHGHTHEGGDHDHAHADDHDDAPAMTQETAEGTIGLFMESLKSGDFEGAAAVADPSSIGYESLTGFAESLVQAASKPEAAGLVDTLRSMYSTPWEDAKATAVSVRDERAKYEVGFANGLSVNLDIVKNEAEGLWQVFLPDGFMDVGIKKSESGTPDGQAG